MKIIFYVHEQRIKAKMSIRELATKSGVTKSYIQRIEAEQENLNPSIKVMYKLAKALDVEFMTLFKCID